MGKTMELLGIILPIFIDVINKRIESSRVKFWVALAFCVGVGIPLNYLETLYQFGTIPDAVESISQTILAVFGITQLSYKGWYEESQLREMVHGERA